MKCRNLLAVVLVGLGFAVPLTAARADDSFLTPAKKDHWAWRKPVRPPIPNVKLKTWPQNPIDTFVLARLESVGLMPAPKATRAQFLRRVTFDLVGLPPTPSEIDAFLRDDAPDAHAKVIDRLLASPHYGERWGRHWLDLARFAETNGFEHDEIRPDAWRYRDYVIKTFNANKPYDRFLKEQLAGDELFPDDPDALIATGFSLLGPDMTDSASQAQRRQNTLDDMTDTTGLVFLGLTLGCARCHDHKFEPIYQADFYRVQAFFAPADFRKDLPVASKEAKADHDRRAKQHQTLIRPTLDAVAALERPYREKLLEARLGKISDEARTAHRVVPEKRTLRQKELVATTARLVVVSAKEVIASLKGEDRVRHQALQKELQTFAGKKPAPLPVAMGLKNKPGAPAKTFLLRRGELHSPADLIEPAWPVILSPDFEAKPLDLPDSPHGTGRRAALASWMASPDNPLTARVFVNRVWQHHFGRGIVPTASDFGVRGEPPTHPELLDWLAVEFVAKGWDIKQLHRLMLTSATYQQSTLPSAASRKLDPENRLFSRMQRLRLEGEIVRDTLLAVSGRLNPKRGGPGVFPPLPEELGAAAKGWTTSPDPSDHTRRSIYIFARRNLRFPFLEALDLPDSNLSCPKRERSTSAPQALALLNSADVVAAAHALSKRLQSEADSAEDRITLAYRLTLGRPPDDEERSLAREFLADSPLSEFCRALFNLNEFVYLD